MKAFIIAGEPSGDRLGAALMAGLKVLTEVEFQGVGGALMGDQGLVSQFPMEELSVMGLAEILPKYCHLKRRIRETADAVLAAKPDVLITIDSPDFCLRVARRVKSASDIRTVHYVAPTVWAWRAGRAAKMARVIDHVLALFPFEPPLMQAAGMACDFVGHPVVAEPIASLAEIDQFRATHGLGKAPVMLALPGSRMGEVARLAPIFGEALRPVLAKYPDMRLVVPTVASVTAQVKQAVRDWPVRPIILDPRGMNIDLYLAEKRASFGAADLALAASGTVSLELAAAATPMVIAYDMSWLSRQIIARMLKVDTVTLVNLVSETRSIPEFIGDKCKPQAIAKGLIEVMADPQRQLAAMEMTMQRLGQGGQQPGLRAAHAVLAGLNLPTK
jgi:lipid-A-disaccharide synthase